MLSNSATEQLLTSDAVDQTISKIDFNALSNKKVYFDTTYIKNVKGIGFVNGDYITSSLRQQIVAANCLIQEKKEDADYIIEARVGTLATNGHEVNYGIPASNMLSSAATLVPAAPAIPAIPEISLAKKNNQSAAAKISVFAYNQKTRERVWQSGVLQSKSTARDTWILGAGPFQRGTIYKGGTEFAGSKLEISLPGGDEFSNASTVDYLEAARFVETPKADSANAEVEKREVKTLEEWIKSESTNKTKQEQKGVSKAPKSEAKSAEAKQLKATPKANAIPSPPPAVNPAKIKTDLFLKPEKTTGYQDWLQGDSPRISKVWPEAPESKKSKADQKKIPSDSPVSKPDEKIEFDGMFRKIPTQ